MQSNKPLLGFKMYQQFSQTQAHAFPISYDILWGMQKVDTESALPGGTGIHFIASFIIFSTLINTIYEFYAMTEYVMIKNWNNGSTSDMKNQQ